MSAGGGGTERRVVRRLASLETGWRDPEYLLKRPLFEHVRDARRYGRGRLLDVGCGNRPYGDLFRPVVSTYVGVDPDRIGSRPDIAAIAEALPFPDETFDTALALAVLEHVTEPARILAEIRRVLRPGGHLILLAPQYWRLHEEPQDYYRFTRYGLEYLVHQQGFALVEIRHQGGAWTLAGQAICGALQRRTRLRVLIPLVNACFEALERLRPDPGDAISYLLIARR